MALQLFGAPGRRFSRTLAKVTFYFAVQFFILADFSRPGITEVQIIQWYVEEGAHVEEWKPLCQYQSDKAVDDVRSFVLFGMQQD